MSGYRRVIANAALIGSLGAMTGCGSGVPFNSQVVGTDIVAPDAGGAGPAATGVLQNGTEQSVATILAFGQLTSLDITMRVTTTGGPATLGVVVTDQSALGADQFWTIASSGPHLVTKQVATNIIGATLTISQPGRYVFASVDPHDPQYSYAGSLLQVAASSTSAFSQTQFIQQFTQLVQAGKPVYTFIGTFKQPGQGTAVINSLAIGGKVVPNLGL